MGEVDGKDFDSTPSPQAVASHPSEGYLARRRSSAQCCVLCLGEQTDMPTRAGQMDVSTTGRVIPSRRPLLVIVVQSLQCKLLRR